MSADELSSDDARATIRRVGTLSLARDSVRRFRYGDGFSTARALGFQFVLAFIPLVIAVVGLSSTVQAEKPARALRQTLLSLSPGTGDDAVRESLRGPAMQAGTGERVALLFGLLAALIALVTSMGQLERGANRIYGIQRDRPSLKKYTRAAMLAFAAGIPAMLGFLILIAGGTALDSFSKAYDWSPTLTDALHLVRWPVGALLGLAAITLIFKMAPRRKQPAMSWMAYGAGLALLLWLLFTGLLAVYVATSASFGKVYGPLTGVIALLLWAQLTSLALLLGIAFAAQLEAVRSGVPAPDTGDPEPEGAATGPVVTSRM
jgi:YihY family inner membrane protein